MTNKKIKKSGLRVINNGTRYDVAGKILKLGRSIAGDKEGDVRNVVVAVQTIETGGGIKVETYHFGQADIAMALLIWERSKTNISG